MVDPVEAVVATALTGAGIAFTRENERREPPFLDFHLTDLDLFIEVKQYSTPRTAKQIEGLENVVVVQGKAAAAAFAKLLEKTDG